MTVGDSDEQLGLGMTARDDCAPSQSAPLTAHPPGEPIYCQVTCIRMSFLTLSEVLCHEHRNERRKPDYRGG